jgi:hypothetical protein
MTQSQIASLRRLADSGAVPLRLRAIDALAADAGVYFTLVTLTTSPISPARKAVRFVRQALKRLRRARLNPKMRSAVESRLLFMSGVSVSEEIFASPTGAAGVPTPKPMPSPQPQPIVGGMADEIRKLLAEHGG